MKDTHTNIHNSPNIQSMLDRVQDLQHAIHDYNMDTNENESWILGLDLFGYKTHYIVEDDGNVLVRIEGSQDHMPLFEQLTVIRELALYNEWVPFCNKSELIKQISETEIITFLNIWSPLGLSRDLVISGYGADCLYEHGKIIIVAKSIDSYPDVELPPATSSWFHDRANMKSMSVVFDVRGPEEANV
jgi:hypothetical protein